MYIDLITILWIDREIIFERPPAQMCLPLVEEKNNRYKIAAKTRSNVNSMRKKIEVAK